MNFLCICIEYLSFACIIEIRLEITWQSGFETSPSLYGSKLIYMC